MDRITEAGLCFLILVAPAQARSLPKADPAPKLEACAGMGPGFFKMEGSETCVKLSGSVRGEVAKQSGGSMFVPSQH